MIIFRGFAILFGIVVVIKLARYLNYEVPTKVTNARYSHDWTFK